MTLFCCSGDESRALPRRIYKIISIKRIPPQEFLFSVDENLYDDLFLDYKFRSGAISKHLSTCSFHESETTLRNIAVEDSLIGTGT